MRLSGEYQYRSEEYFVFCNNCFRFLGEPSIFFIRHPPPETVSEH